MLEIDKENFTFTVYFVHFLFLVYFESNNHSQKIKNISSNMLVLLKIT